MAFKDKAYEREFYRKRSATLYHTNIEESRRKQREYVRKRREADPELFRRRLREWHAKNREKSLACGERQRAKRRADPEAMAKQCDWYAKYREVNKVRINKYKRAWEQRNPDKMKLKEHKRRALQAKAGGYCSKDAWLARCEYYGWCCAYCHSSLTQRKANADHVIPIALGGSSWPANLVPACKPCNSRKRERRWIPQPVWAKEAH